MLEAEAHLERLVFGDLQLAGESWQSSAQTELLDRTLDSSETLQAEADDLYALEDSQLFFTDLERQDEPQGRLWDGSDRESSEDDPVTRVWEDSDDERLCVALAKNPQLRKLRHSETEHQVYGEQYIRRLRVQFETLHPKPEWARDSHGLGISDLQLQPLRNLMQRSSSLLLGPRSSASLTLIKYQPELIDVQRMPDVADAQPSAITSLCFHPSLPFLLSGGPSGRLALHNLPEEAQLEDKKILASLHVRANRGLKAYMTSRNDGTVFFSSRRAAHHAWDLASGQISTYTGALMTENGIDKDESFSVSPDGIWLIRYGWMKNGGGVVHIIDLSSNHWIGEARVDSIGGVADTAWWPDSSGFTVLGKTGQIIDYSLTSQEVVAKWTDEGAVSATKLALGGELTEALAGGHRWLAIGTTSGIVNIYDRSHPSSTTSRPKLIKYLEQLTTPISHLAFSPDAQILCMGSRWKKDSLRLVHVSSMTVYRNWPSSSTPLGKITAVAWGLHHFLAIGNEQGRIRLWQMRG